jgi:RNA polymerase sigma-70 factor (ECF subfamily)
MPSTESEWLSGARRLDERTLDEIYDALSPALFRYAFRLLGDRQSAEDVVAETFHRLLLALRAGAGPQEHLRAYLYRIAHNLAMDRRRRDQRRGPEVGLDDLPLTGGEDPAQAAERTIAADRARAALWVLTADQRQVIVLKSLEGLTNEEIASSLGKPVGAIKSMQHRALEALRRTLGTRTEREA